MKTPFYTGSGDDGVVRVGTKEHSKGGPLFEALGHLDTTNTLVGWAKVASTGFVTEACSAIQELLFVAQAEVAALGFGNEPKYRIREGHITHLEQIIAYVDERTPELHAFIIPGGTELAARLDVARTAARTLERSAVRASRDGAEHLSPEVLKFMNRLSSVLFALARLANHEAGVEEEHPSYGKSTA